MNQALVKTHALASDIYSLCSSLFEQTLVNFFYFGRYYDDGRGYILTSDSSWVDNHFAEQHALVVPASEDIISDKFYYPVLPSDCFQQGYKDVTELCSIANIINCIYRHEGYFDLACFAMSNDACLNKLEYYMNRLKTLDKFYYHFVAETEKLAKTDDIVFNHIPELMLPNFRSCSYAMDMELTAKSFEIPRATLFNKSCTVRLAPREYETMKYLYYQYPAKTIAAKLCISPKTVESYIQSVMNKLGCVSRVEMVKILHKHNALFDL